MFAEVRDIISKVDNGLTWVPSLQQKKTPYRGTFGRDTFLIGSKIRSFIG